MIEATIKIRIAEPGKNALSTYPPECDTHTKRLQFDLDSDYTMILDASDNGEHMFEVIDAKEVGSEHTESSDVLPAGCQP